MQNKINTIVRIEFVLVYVEDVVQHFSYYAEVSSFKENRKIKLKEN